MKIYDLCGNDGLASGIYRLEFIGWNLSVGIYRCRAARGGLNFKIYDICLGVQSDLNPFSKSNILSFRAAGGGNFIADLSSQRSNGGDERGGALASYTQLWQLKSMSDADGFVVLAAAAAVEIRQQWRR